MRGKAHDIEVLKDALRITPAYAGKSWHSYGPKNCRRDHPRVCGEKRARALQAKSSAGSPPRMRGKAYDPERRARRRRITPAYAGKRWRVPAKLAASRDHPRVCGEKYSLALFLGLHQGSPPRMRGKGKATANIKSTTGITPAYAGKSQGLADIYEVLGDHPRVCGEKVD